MGNTSCDADGGAVQEATAAQLDANLDELATAAESRERKTTKALPATATPTTIIEEREVDEVGVPPEAGAG